MITVYWNKLLDKVIQLRVNRNGCSMLIVMVCFLQVFSNVLAQDNERYRPDAFWLDIGFSFTQVKGSEDSYRDGAFGSRTALNFRMSRLRMTLPFTFNIGGVNRGIDTGPTQDHLFDLGLLGGYDLVQNRSVELALSTGMAGTWGKRVVSSTRKSCGERPSYTGNGSYSYCDFHTTSERQRFPMVPGIPIELAIRFPKGPLKSSAVVHWNINKEGNFLNLSFNLNL